MRIVASGNATILCPSCNNSLAVPPPSPEDWEVVEKQPREMGVETTYCWYDEIYCDCGQSFQVTAEAWEYPEEALNDNKLSVVPGEVQKKWQLVVEHSLE